jgi:uncharacterized membrane protein (UPF0127 family)
MKSANLKITRYTSICLGFLYVTFATAPIVRADTAPLIMANISTGSGMVHHFQLELAETPERRAKGLMYRKSLPADGGMLFVWPNKALRLFWMKNTPLFLDILFFDEAGKLVYLHPEAVPFSQDTISSRRPAKYVVEIHAKTAERLGFDRKSTLSFAGPLPAAR